ncbi:unnamed protein product [Paramecium sonneborni]|uniref:WD40-repeat-containing domain n=1 Tax=Paramecium sonneborni TaxID=65129 RepID=A0A8S1RRW7_9CILI|nr:unnamed protein product [Paramecium sonneborni]
MIENEKLLQCAFKHQQPIVSVILNPQISKEQRLLCTECLSSINIEEKVIGFKKIIEILEQRQYQKMSQIEPIIEQIVNYIEQILNYISQLKSNAIQQLVQLSTLLKDWIINLQSTQLKYQQYSFHEELEIIIKNSNTNNFDLNPFIKDISKQYSNQIEKVSSKLEQYNQFQEYNKCKQILQNLQDIIKQGPSENINQGPIIKNNEGKDIIQIVKQPLLKEGAVKLNLIDSSVKQMNSCISIVFNPPGSIMVSTNKEAIKIWNFNNGRIQLQQTLKQHTAQVNCLIYSRIQDGFLSGSDDKTIIVWKLEKQNQWISSQPYQQHTDKVYCLILNQNENQLFSGSEDMSIKVGQLDFKKNKLIYQYELNKHKNKIYALSLNQSESLLVSCAHGQNEIIIWKKGLQNKMEFKYVVKQSTNSSGGKVKFIKENQFIWVSDFKYTDKIFIFELKEGVFHENQQKTIELNFNNQELDKFQFPIIHNMQRNLLVLRHGSYIYLIRELNNEKFKIVEQLKCYTNDIFGTITNNGSHLVFWDSKNQSYSIYKLSYQ